MESFNAKQLHIVVRDTAGRNRVLTESLPPRRISIDAVVPLLQAVCDVVVSIQLSDRRVSCTAGCARCCYQLIPISPAEALFFNKLLRRLPRERRRRIERDFKAIRDKSESLASVTAAKDDFDLRYFDLKMACPFLENDRCGIYRQRPLACREYHVDTPSRLCGNPYRSDIHRVAKGLNIAGLLAALCKHLFHASGTVLPLFAMDRWGDDHPYARTTFDPEWLFTRLLHGIARASEREESISGIEWQFIDREVAEKPAPSQMAVPADRPDHRANALLTPRDLGKVLVQYANAENVRKIANRLLLADERLKTGHRVVEIGSGDGYLHYLGQLSNDRDVRKFLDSVIETEHDETIVADNRAKGRDCLLMNARDIAERFGERFTPLVLSFNVLDVFSSPLLEEALASISAALMDEGRVVHIMSSAIHKAVFVDIAEHHRGRILLPFYDEGTIGVTLVEKSFATTTDWSHLAARPDSLSDLFKQSPERYLSIAAQVAIWIRRTRLPCETVLLHDYSIRKLSAAMIEAGFAIEYSGDVESTVVVNRSDLSLDTNNVTNRFGALTLDYKKKIAAGDVQQTSRFWLLIGRKQ